GESPRFCRIQQSRQPKAGPRDARKLEQGGRRTEDGRRKTEDGGRKTGRGDCPQSPWVARPFALRGVGRPRTPNPGRLRITAPTNPPSSVVLPPSSVLCPPS